MRYTILGFSGRAGAGKDSAATLITQFMGRRPKIMRFADPLKAFYEYCTGEQIISLMQDNRELYDQPAPGYDCTRREWLQNVGTEALRGMDPKFHIRAMDNRLSRIKEKAIGQSYIKNGTYPPVICIPDVRFTNEADYIKSIGGLVIHLQRELAPAMAHASELFDPEAADLILENNGSIQDLKTKCSIIAKDLAVLTAGERLKYTRL